MFKVVTDRDLGRKAWDKRGWKVNRNDRGWAWLFEWMDEIDTLTGLAGCRWICGYVQYMLAMSCVYCVYCYLRA
jgi:hypothetical protein